ncbi:Hypothetical protein, putative [Bodo saltans]|uniref:Uncharacterized protein n=1 Tax=Bodo saltans TaxID=75058 RepID=A0A0S4JJN7_BODSA|nr:Hypothetical protein, putative [Bodo saltans]|eukprot:CUG91757.1 Hypothetical protein, putative [Bodo saltans]
MNEESLFESIIEGISNDRFLTFIEQYTHALISPLSAKHLRWCSDFTDDDSAGVVPLSSSPQDSPSSSPTSIFQFSQQHFAVFQMYQLMFESRISSVLKKATDGAISPERFFEICARILAEKPANILAAGVESVSLHINLESAGRPILVSDLCETLLDMVESVSSFQTFAALMAERQRKLLIDDKDAVASDDDES